MITSTSHGSCKQSALDLHLAQKGMSVLSLRILQVCVHSQITSKMLEDDVTDAEIDILSYISLINVVI